MMLVRPASLLDYIDCLLEFSLSELCYSIATKELRQMASTASSTLSVSVPIVVPVAHIIPIREATSRASWSEARVTYAFFSPSGRMRVLTLATLIL